MAGLEDLLVASQMAAAIDMMRFDTHITAFEFKPSLGIVAKRFMELGEEFQDMSVPLKRGIKDVMTISILENFMSGGRPSWPELSESTLRQRAEKGEGTMLMVRSGSLAEVASSEGIWSVGKTSAAVRDLPDSVWYGKVHQAGQEGNSFGGGKWFDKYKKAASSALGPEADRDEVEKLAFKMFDKRTLKHGAAPRSTPDIPARPFILFQDEDIDAIQLIFIEWIEEKIVMAGLR